MKQRFNKIFLSFLFALILFGCSQGSQSSIEKESTQADDLPSNGEGSANQTALATGSSQLPDGEGEPAEPSTAFALSQGTYCYQGSDNTEEVQA